MEKKKNWFLRLHKKWIVIGIAVSFIGFRIALPFLVCDFINQKLAHLSDYRGHIDNVSLKIWRGAYEIHHLKVEKVDGQKTYPFAALETAFLSIQWKELIHGSLVGYVKLTKPELNYILAKTEAESQLEPPEQWQDIVVKFFPLTINRLDIEKGEIHFRDLRKKPELNVYVQELSGYALNLTNSTKSADSQFGKISVTGKMMTTAALQVDATINPLKIPSEAFIQVQLKDLNLTELNPFFTSYASFDVKKGKFGLFTELAIGNNKLNGYIKPFLNDLTVFEWKKDSKKPVLQFLWQGVVGLVGQIFRNQPKDSVAARIPIHGKLNDPKVDTWATIGSVLKNAFIQALTPKLDHTVKLESVLATGKQKKR